MSDTNETGLAGKGTRVFVLKSSVPLGEASVWLSFWQEVVASADPAVSYTDFK